MSKLIYKGHAASLGKCETCKYKYNDEDRLPCAQCRDNPLSESFYEEQIDPLKNLFKGAPVIVGDNDQRDLRRYFIKHKNCFYSGETEWSKSGKAYNTWTNIRLPTIEESPRNVWLAAPADEKCPEGAEELLVMVWRSGEEYPFPFRADLGKNWNWYNGITKFMILDKEAFEYE